MTFESGFQPESGFSNVNIDGEGDPPQSVDAVWDELAPSCVVRFSQTQNFFRRKKLEVSAGIFFEGFPFTVLVVRLILWRRRG